MSLSEFNKLLPEIEQTVVRLMQLALLLLGAYTVLRHAYSLVV